MPDPHPAGPHPDGHHIAHASARLSQVRLDGEALTRLSPMLEADRAQAVADLEAENRFAPIASATGIAGLRHTDIGAGPFVLHLSIQEGRLVFEHPDPVEGAAQVPVGGVQDAHGKNLGSATDSSIDPRR